jgi:hypothetical protein
MGTYRDREPLFASYFIAVLGINARVFILERG